MKHSLDLDPNPIHQFELWFQEAKKISRMEFPDAMALATSSPDGRPSLRMVLFKGIRHDAFTFVTNYESRKAKEIDANPKAALCFFWDWTGHQVRVEGTVEKFSSVDSDNYFRSRPRESQIGAWASPQSRQIDSREELEKKVIEAERRFAGIEVPRPAHWGGYLLKPDRMEFWKNIPHRLHDRFEYLLQEGNWRKRRLAP